MPPPPRPAAMRPRGRRGSTRTRRYTPRHVPRGGRRRDGEPEPDDAGERSASRPPRPALGAPERAAARSSATPDAPARETRPREWAVGIGSAVAAVLATVLVLVAFGALGGRHRSPLPPPVVTNAGDVIDYAVAERVGAVVAPSVVTVKVGGETTKPVGSGVVLKSDRVITAAHLLTGATDVEVSTTTGDNLKARVVGVDPQTDLALLAVTGGDLQLATLGSWSPPRVGQTVVAVTAAGNHYRVGINVVSDLDVMVDAGTGIDVAGLLETGITVSPDMAGGALVDPDGNLVGILTRPATTGPAGLAIPVALVRDVEDQLDSSGSSGKVTHGWLGVVCRSRRRRAARRRSPDRRGDVRAVPPRRRGCSPAMSWCGPTVRWSAVVRSWLPRCAASDPRTPSPCSTNATGGPAPSPSTSEPVIPRCSRTSRQWPDPANCPSAGFPRDHEGMTTTVGDDGLEVLDRELLNAVQWDFPLEPRPYAVLGERLGLTEDGGPGTHRPGQGARGAPPAVGDLRHPRPRLRLGAGRGADRPRPGRRRRRGDQRAPRRQPQLQAQPRVQPLVHDRGPAGRVARGPHRRAPPRLGRARHPQAPHAEALQDRREARHDRQHRGRRQGRGARAREARAARAHGRARAVRPRDRDHPRGAGRPAARRAAVRRVRRADRLRRGHRAASCCARSRSASSCVASPR